MVELRFVGILLEAVAAVCGLFYYKKNPSNKSVGFFAYFLLATYFVEIIGSIPAIIYWNEKLHFLQGTFISKNFWLYNPYIIVSFSVYIFFIRWNLKEERLKKIISYLLFAYVMISVLNLFFSNVFFKNHSMLSYGLGTLILVGVIFLYYIEILRKDRILSIKHEICFYISFIAMLHFLTVTPIIIYFRYYTFTSPEFVQLTNWFLICMNIFMYSSYSIAFLWLANKKKHPFPIYR